jgi:two-component system, NarL family, response regulator
MNRPDRLKLLIVDDHAVVREGLEAMLGVDPAFEAIATGASAEDAVRLCSEFHPDVVLLDLRMPQADGFSALEVIHVQWPEIRVLVLSAGASAAEIKLVRRNGASGYMSKSADRATLIAAIMTIADGGSVFPQELPSAPTEIPALSARELEVLRHLGRGLSSYELGVALGISSETVKSHIKAIFQKLSVTTRAEAVSRAFEIGLLAVDR